MTDNFRRRLKNLLGPRWAVFFRCLFRGKALPRWGNLRRVKPFSAAYGTDRGSAVDRYYVDQFFDKNRSAISGDVIEIQGAGYTRRFGHSLRRVDTLDVSPAFNPTFVCDLAEASGVVPDEAYDCFLLPNTPQHLRRLDECLRQALRVVRPGGTILASSPTFVPLIADGPDYWRLSPAGWEEVARRCWPGCEVEVTGHGNCLATVAAMMGLAWEEITPRELDCFDPRYPVLVTVRCRKPARGVPGSGGNQEGLDR